MHHKRFALVLIVAMGATLFGALSLGAQGPQPFAAQANLGTAFTYQGQLKNGGGAVTGSCDFQFALFDALALGARIGATQTVATLPVANGLFATPLDFGAGALTGDARFLNIQLRCPAGAGAYTTLTPRQNLTPAPMALALPGLWTRQNATSPNLIGGYSGNVISPTVVGGVIGGGGSSTYINRVTGDHGTVSGGQANTAGGLSVVAGGYTNQAIGQSSAIGGGIQNVASSNWATISGGSFNEASGELSTVPGGAYNLASGTGSFAAGINANAIHTGTFVWADTHYAADFESTGEHQFLIRAQGGVGVNTNTPAATLTVKNSKGVSALDNTATFLAPDLGPNQSHIHYGTLGNWYIRSAAGSGQVILQDTGGNVGIGTGSPSAAYKLDVAGKLRATGGFNGQCLSAGNFNTTAANACNMDFAEAFASVEHTAPGDLVALATLDSTTAAGPRTPAVRKTARAYDDLLIGVVSQNPGLVFDNGKTYLAGDNSQLITADKTVVALVGRVFVNVTLENGPIATGDPLTSAGTPGAAMKATRAGKIIGYALEAAAQDGQALVLLQPGLYLPGETLATESENALLQARIAALEARDAASAARLSALEQRAMGVTPEWLMAAVALCAGLVLVAVLAGRHRTG